MSEKSTVIYEVNLEVDPGVAEEFRDWLQGHVAEMLTLPGFEGASAYRREVGDPDNPDEPVELVVLYRMASRAALEDYLLRHAERMRAQTQLRFQDRFRARRRILLGLE